MIIFNKAFSRDLQIPRQRPSGVGIPSTLDKPENKHTSGCGVFQCSKHIFIIIFAGYPPYLVHILAEWSYAMYILSPGGAP